MFLRIGIALVVMLSLAASVVAGEQVVWQIGTLDNGYAELAIAANYGAYSGAFPGDVTFRPGVDEPAKSWPFVQPGPTDAWAGSKTHPFTIVFNLPDEPRGVFPLTIDLVNTHYGGPPRLRISINGTAGERQLPAGTSDESLTNPAVGREHVLRIPLPASILRKGENRIVFATVGGSWLLYDAVTLANDPEASPVEGVSKLTLSPTMRFVRDGKRLKQALDLTAELAPGSEECTGELRSGDTVTRVTLRAPFLGTVHQELLVDEVSAPTKAMFSVTAGGKTVTAECEVKPQRHWLFYVQPSSHVDIGYTDLQERVAVLHNDNMSLALDLCRKYPSFKWNTEAAWVEDSYLSMMPKEKADEFLKLARDGRIGCQAIYGNMLTGICSHESFIRDLYYAHAIAKAHGIPYDIAMSSDVPTQVWTLPTVLAGAGIRYFSAGLNLTRGDSFNKLFARSPFYWQGPDGSKVLTWYADSYAKATVTHLVSGVEPARGGVEAILRAYDRDDYPYDAVLGFGGYWDNVRMNDQLAKTVDEWNKRYAYPKVILCRGPEFFEYIEAGYRDKIPTISGDGGVYWEDGAGSSAHETALVRCAKEDLVTAEKAFALASVLSGAKYPQADVNEAWKNAILYDEHTWGAAGSISHPTSEQTVKQWDYKARFATKAAAQTRRLLRSGLQALADSVKTDQPSILVFNPLDTPAGGLVRIQSPSGETELWADPIPPLSYRLYPSTPSPVREAATDSPTYPLSRPYNGTGEGRGEGKSGGDGNSEIRNPEPEIENAFYRLRIDPSTGAVKSLFDKELGRELVDAAAPYGLNQYIYVSGHDKSLQVHGEVLSPVTIETEALPHRTVVRVTGSAYMTPQWTTEIVLYDDTRRIDFRNTIWKKETYDKEAGYFVFPFAMDKPEFRIELPNGVMRPDRDMLPGACMQWYCMQDYVTVSDPGCTVVWSAVESPMITLCDINRDTFQSPLPINNGHLYAYAFNNYWFTNYKASQGGALTFRYSLTSMPKYDPVAASRFGQSVRNPLVGIACGQAKAGAESFGSLVTVSQPNVVVQAVKPAESCRGLIIRLREIAGRETEASITLGGGKFREAWKCNLVEDPQTKLRLADGQMKLTIPANGLATVLVSR